MLKQIWLFTAWNAFYNSFKAKLLRAILRFELTFRAKACNPDITWRGKIGIKLVVTWLTWKSLIASVEDSVRVLSLYLDAISMNSKFWEVNKNLYQIRQSMFYPQQVCLVNLSLFTVWPADRFCLIQNCPSDSRAILISIFLSLGLEQSQISSFIIAVKNP